MDARLSSLLNILQTCFSPSWGGLEIQALEVTRQLAKRGHHVWLACSSGSRLEREAIAAGVTVLSLNIRGYVHPILAWNLGKFLRRESISIIHSQLSKDIPTVVAAMRFSGRSMPVVLSKRVGSYLNKKDLLHRLTHRHVSMVMAISSVIHKNVLDTLPVAPDRVMTVHDAIDLERFVPSQADRDRVRTELGLQPESMAIGCVGRFSPGKGHEEFLEAAAILAPRFPQARFVIVGEESYGEKEYAARIRAMSGSLGLHDVVVFAGYRNDMPDVMAAFDIFAFPSHAEAFGVVLIEAMAMEKPVVSTNCDGVLDIVVDGETGIYVHPRNSLELAEGLTRLIESPVLGERMGKAGRLRVERLFDQKRQIGRIEEVYEKLLEARSGNAGQ